MSSYKALLRQKIESMKQNGAFHIVLGSFMTKFVSFFGSIFIVRLLSKTDYGILSYYENFVSYFIVLAGFGLDAALLRYMVLSDGMPAKKGCYSHALARGSVWNLFLVSAGLLILYFYPHKEAFKDQFPLALCLALCMPFVFFENASLGALRGLFKNKSYAIIAFGIAFIQISSRMIGAALGGLQMTVRFRLAADILCGLFCIGFLFHKCFSSVSLQPMEKSFAKEMDRYSVQMMITNSLWAIFMLNDLFLLGQLSGDEIVIADYKVAYVIPANLSVFIVAVGIFVAPYFTKNDKEKNFQWIREKSKLVLLITASIMCVLTFLCFLLAKPIIHILYGEQYLSAVPIMRLLLVASFFNNGIRGSLANILSAVGKQKANLLVAAFGMILQVSLDVMLIPRFGAMGVAFSSSIVYLAMSCFLIVFFKKKYLDMLES